MNIPTDKIIPFINFLYQKKYQTSAPQELLDKWKNVPMNQLETQLNNLYSHWNMSINEVSHLETEFNSMQAYNAPPQHSYAPPPPSINNYNPTPQQAPSSANSGPWKMIAFSLLGLLVIAAAFYFYNQNKSESNLNNDGSILKNEEPKVMPITQNDTPIEKVEAKADTVVAKVETNEDVEKESSDRTRKIQKLLSAETDRNVNGILENFDPKVLQYWEMKNPTELQLRDVYMKTWTKADDIQYKNVNIKRVSKNTYDLFADYSYFSVKDGEYKKMSVQTRYVFNDNGKIIRTFGINVNGR